MLPTTMCQTPEEVCKVYVAGSPFPGVIQTENLVTHDTKALIEHAIYIFFYCLNLNIFL